MAFSPSFLDELRARVPLASVIGQNVRLTKKGREYSGLCPFHNEKSPSFTVNEEKGFFHCFGCGAHGDVITFEMRANHLSFVDAIEKLAGIAGLAMPVATPQDRAQEQRQASLHDVLDRAANWFVEQLNKGAGIEARDYLKRRGLDEGTIARFRLGFAPDSRSGLKSFLGAELEALAIEAGLLIQPEERGTAYDRFRGRVMFPITDRRGRVIAFGGRIMGDGQPKYLNSPDTPLFHKGHILYGWAQARSAAAKSGTVLVAEGYMDVIALHRAGFDNAVAPLGTALTEQQIEMMWREVNEPILCLDGDAAGQRAALRAAERALTILKPGKSLRFASLPVPEDPDSLIQKAGPAAMQAVCDQAKTLSDTLWQAKFSALPLATPEQRSGAEQQIKQFLDVIPESGLKRDYIYEFTTRLRAAARAQRPPLPFGGRSKMALKPKTVTYAPRNAAGAVAVMQRASPLPPPAETTQEKLLLVLILEKPWLLDEVAESLGYIQFSDSNLDKLRQDVLIHAHGLACLDREAVYDHLKSRGFSQTLDCLQEAIAHELVAIRKPDISEDEVRRQWQHIFDRYRQKELAVDFELAQQRSAVDLTDETNGFVAALWSGRNQNSDL